MREDLEDRIMLGENYGRDEIYGSIVSPED